MRLDDTELVKRATRAYFRRFGQNAQQPSHHSGIERNGAKKYVVLQNTTGILAVDGSSVNAFSLSQKDIRLNLVISTMRRGVQ